MSKDDASLQRIDALSKSAPYNFYQEKKSPFVNDKDMVYGQALGLTIFAEFKRGEEKAFSFAELFLSKIPQESTHRQRYTLGQHVPVVVQKAWGMVALYSASMKVLTGSSGSFMAYKNNILSVLYSVDGKESWGAIPAPNSTVIVGTKVDHHEDALSASDDSTQSSTPNSDLTVPQSPPPHSIVPSQPPPSSPSSPTGNGPPNKPPEKIGVPNSAPSPSPTPDSSAGERVAAIETTTPSREPQQQPSQGSGRIASTGGKSTSSQSMPSGSHDQQQKTATNPCVPR